MTDERTYIRQEDRFNTTLNNHSPGGQPLSRVIGVELVMMSETGTMQSLWLPGHPEGKYTFQPGEDQEDCSFVYIEAIDGRWFLCCNRPARLLDPSGGSCSRMELVSQCIFTAECGGQSYILYAEAENESSNIYHNYYIEEHLDIQIGRTPVNDICYPNRLVSRNHAVLRREGDRWTIRDLNSTNGVFVNGRRIREACLRVGDQVYIMGLRMIVGIGFLSMNDGNDRITINSGRVRLIAPGEQISTMTPPGRSAAADSLFNRLPRKRLALPTEPIVIDGPPMSMNGNQIPMMLRMGSSMVMGGSALLAGNITMVLSSLVFPFLNQRYSEKDRKEYEERRVAKYTEYLDGKKREIHSEQQKEQQILNQNYPVLGEILQFPGSGERLWERRRTDDDFLSVRLGTGRRPLLIDLEYPPRRFDLNEDKLELAVQEMASKPVTIDQVPIMTSLVEDFVCGVLGNRGQALAFVRQLVMQLSILHSYDEVKLVFLLEPEELKILEFIKFLPHLWDDQKAFRFLATSAAEAYQISEYIKRELGDDLEKPPALKDILKHRPYYVVFALSKRIFDSMEVLKDILQEEQNCGVSVLAVFDDLPKECSKVFRLNLSGEHAVTHLREMEKADVVFRMDAFDARTADLSMKQLANINLKMVSQAYSLPKMITFLEMFGVGRVEHLNPLKRWTDNNPVKTLAAPVGVATDGQIFTLDLHEKFQGPHGLVAGMTGSGKSEFIVTYILSMAVNYHPDEVAFVLIDYKGGGLTGAFEDKARGIHLPHLVGTITNLDGSAIQRSLMSIQSELMRRQALFNEAKSATGEGTMDIYSYQKLRRNGKVSEPLPHLFIISDEFAELKKQQPEFMDQLISAARIGRSLGVHLILATQKPAGVVNDQIWSNTKFRVCLRVQDRTDSMDMLKRPEAAELKDTGRFYLQVGYNEFFALGQSAWCGAAYEPQDQVVVQKDNSVQFIDTVGQNVLQVKPKVEKTDSGSKQIVAIVRYLSELANREHIVPRQLWKEPLPPVISLQKLLEENRQARPESVRALLGMVDDPEKQTQFPLLLDLQGCQNLLIIGESGSGKSTLLQSMLYSLAQWYSPEEVIFYILDFSSHVLNVFGALPHCGATLDENDTDAIARFFKMLRETITERKKKFAEAQVSSFEAYRDVGVMPLMLVVIDNFAGLVATEQGNTYFNTLHEFMRDGVSYGIKIVASGSHLNEFSTRTRQEAGSRITLQLKDKFAYGDVLNARCNYTPPEVKGRGICSLDGRLLEYHTAMYVGGQTERERIRLLRSDVQALAGRYAGCQPAPRLPVFSETETYEEFCRSFGSERIPLGYAVKDFKRIALPFKQMYSLSLYFGNPVGVAPVLRNLLYAADANDMEVLLLKKTLGSRFEGPDAIPVSRNVTLMSCTEADSVTLWNRLAQEIGTRKVHRNAYCEAHGLQPTDADAMQQASRYIRRHTRPLLVLFESFHDFCKNADDSCLKILPTIFQQGAGYNYYFAACFYPDDAAKLSSEALMSAYNPEKMLLLFGGQFHRQGLDLLPAPYSGIRKVSATYNTCLMKYKGAYNQFRMPCGPLEETEFDADDDAIF